MIVYDRLRRLLKRRNQNFTILHNEAGISWTTIRRINNGENIETDTIDKIMSFLEIKSFDEIMEHISDN